MSHEIELKFGFAPESLPALAAALDAAGARRERLRAHYVDTPERLLAHHRIALRLRQEGPRWVQTLKAQGESVAHRLEHNAEVAAPESGDAPALVLARHDGSPAGAALLAVLASAGPGAAERLQPVYGTDLWRCASVIDTQGGRVEAALDEGHILAGGQRLAVCELELELLDGGLDALQALAAEWIPRHGLWLSHATKAERGERLARGEAPWPVVGARPFDGPELRRGVLQSLAQIVPNADAIASGHGEAGHRWQLRIGLRRLGGLLRAHAGAPVDPTLLAATARALGAAGPGTATEAVRAPAFQHALVALTIAALPPGGL